MGFISQTWALTCKNILIALNRHAISTPFRAFVLPVAFILFMSFAKNIYVPPSTFGIGTSHPILGLEQAVDKAGGGRNTIVFVDNGFKNGAIANVISNVASFLPSSDKTIIVTSDESSLQSTCRSSVRGVTTCYGAVIFYSSPHEGLGGIWNYTMKSDWELGTQINVDSSRNDAEVFAIPLQHTIDFAIANLNTTVDQYAISQVQGNIQEYTYTSLTQEERRTQIRTKFMGTIINILAVAFLVALVGITYQLTGFQASERELEMSNLIEAMMPNKKRWEPQVARLLSYHIAFSAIYLPGWLAMAIILASSMFPKTNIVIVILFNVTAGLALGSFSILGASFFKKAQLSGITITIITLLLGIVAQVTAFTDGLVAILSLLFSPCAYVYFIIFVARYERKDMPTDLFRAAPENPWALPGFVLWLFMVIQIFAYPLLGAMVERRLYGAASEGRTVEIMDENALEPVQLRNFRKEYVPNWFYKKFAPNSKKTVVAVKNLSLSARKGQILILLGANGSGKSTTLDAVAGLHSVTSGSITVDGRGGIGIAPQKNVIWGDLTVFEHIKIFNKLKSTGPKASTGELRELITAVDLDRKVHAKAGTLSGGQMRKLQLGMMFTGGSAVCCVDEVSSGLDPLSRRKIWDILLAERGKRTILLTTHFLDEADLLADQIAVLSKGDLRAQGSAVELKSKLGGGFRVHLETDAHDYATTPNFEGFEKRVAFGQVTYFAADSAQAAKLVGMLEDCGIDDYVLEGPTIEDVFLRLADVISQETATTSIEERSTPDIAEKGLSEKGGKAISREVVIGGADGELEGFRLLSGRTITFARQAWVLFRKRLTILHRNYLPYMTVFLLPILASALVTLFLQKNQALPSCAPGGSQVKVSFTENILDQQAYDILVGPSTRLSAKSTDLFQALIPAGVPAPLIARLQQNITQVATFPEFNSHINDNFAAVSPGAIFLGSDSAPPTFAWKGNNYDIYSAIFAQNLLNILLTNISISTQYQSFDIPFTPETGKNLQLVVYFGLAMAAYPAFFALYPTVERIRGVRGLQYSNGVRSLPLWLAYISFDWIFVLLSSIAVISIFHTQSNIWYHLEYLFFVFLFYGMNSILFSYIISLFAKTQLSAFAFAAAAQAISFLVYLVGYLLTLTYVSVNKIDSTLLIIHYTLSLIFPMGSLARSMFITLNIFSTTCVGNEIAPHPFGFNQYGSPLFYLILQVLILFSILLWLDSGGTLSKLFSKKTPDNPNPLTNSSKIDLPLSPVNEPESQSGLVLDHLTKNFKNFKAVKDLSFSVPPNEVFALLGPNGAGKSTTISLIRGDIPPTSGDTYIESIPINLHRSAARRYLGVCPQHDAMDTMTVLEHLQFYARVRGIPDVSFNVRQVLRAVGLESFKTRIASQLSGGNKRKLSLGIALMGNPTVLLLDEPSSGMDAASKRVMWKTLKGVAKDRSILLTTHSMEEADALAGKAGILVDGALVKQGSLRGLRRWWGERWFIHCVCKTAPHTPDSEMSALKSWVISTFGDSQDGVEIEEKTYHGQMRFSVPASPMRTRVESRTESNSTPVENSNAGVLRKPIPAQSREPIEKKIIVEEDDITFISTPTLRYTPDSTYFLGNPHHSSDYTLTDPRTYTTYNPYNENSDENEGDPESPIEGHWFTSKIDHRSLILPAVSQNPGTGAGSGEREGTGMSLGKLVRKIEEDKEMMGLEAYSVGGTGLDQVFLGIVGERLRNGDGGKGPGRWGK